MTKAQAQMKNPQAVAVVEVGVKRDRESSNNDSSDDDSNNTNAVRSSLPLSKRTKILHPHPLPEQQQQKVINLHIQYSYFDMIKKGEKTWEGRLGNLDIQNIQVGQTIVFESQNEQQITHSLTSEVIAIEKYSSFEEMLSNQRLHCFLPNCPSIERGVEIYHQFPRYKEMENSWGAIAFHLKIQDPQ